MSKSSLQKIKLLQLWKILNRDSDEAHPLRTKELCDRLLARGISCDRRTLARDINLLNSQGFAVEICMLGHEKGYYVGERSFTVPELQILVDAVQAANFITEKKTRELTRKLSVLLGNGQAASLRSSTVCFNKRKRSNESIYYNVNTIGQALEQKQAVSFLYFRLDENHNRVYRRDGARYFVEPVALVLQEDRYYLLGLSACRSGKSVYRLDRMAQVQIEPAPLSQSALLEHRAVSDYTGQVFRMFAGQPADVQLQFSDQVLDEIYDKFGEQTRVIRIDETTCTARVEVQISPTFWGWLFQFGGLIRIAAPQSLQEQYTDRLRSVLRSLDAPAAQDEPDVGEENRGGEIRDGEIPQEGEKKA